MVAVQRHPIRLFVLLAVLISMLLPSGFVVNCVGADGHQGNEILGVTHCDDRGTDSTTHSNHSSESVEAFATSDDLGCTDSPLIAEAFSRSDQRESQPVASSPAPLLFVINEDRAGFDIARLDVLRNRPSHCPPHPSAIRCVILIV